MHTKWADMVPDVVNIPNTRPNTTTQTGELGRIGHRFHADAAVFQCSSRCDGSRGSAPFGEASEQRWNVCPLGHLERGHPRTEKDVLARLTAPAKVRA